MEEENIEKKNISWSRQRTIFAYGLVFVLGVLTGNFFNIGNRDALKETANLISQTGKEVLTPSVSGGVNFSLPLKKPAATKTKTVVPAAIPSPPQTATPPGAGEAASSSTTTASSSTPMVGATSTVSVAATSAQIAAVESVQAPPAEESAVVAVAKLLIFEVQITGGPGNSEQDFIKIYNPTPYAVNASGWKLRKRSKTGGESSIKVIPDGTNIASGALLTWANSKENFAATVNAEISSTASIAADGSIAVLDGDGKIIDAVAWGDGVGQFMEGAPYPANPEAGQILRRKTGGANLQDTDNNAADFEV